MTPAALVAAVEALGARLHVAGAFLDVEADAAVPRDLLDALVREKAAVLEFLRTRETPPAPLHSNDRRVARTSSARPTIEVPLHYENEAFCDHRGDGRGPAHLPHECPIHSCRPVREWSGLNLPRNPRASPVEAAQIFMATGILPGATGPADWQLAAWRVALDRRPW